MEEWFERSTKRQAARVHRQEVLRDQLKLWLARDSPSTLNTLEAMPQDGELSTQQKDQVQEALAQCAAKEVNDLFGELPLAWRLKRDPPLTQRALSLAMLCINQRVPAGLEGDSRRERTDAETTGVETLWKQVFDVERSFPFGHRRPFRRWKEQYNVACFFAFPLLSACDGVMYKDELAAEAVRRLELAAASATSSFIARQRDWVTAEDPDLDELRRHPRFKAFEHNYFPGHAPISRLPKCARELAELRCTRDLLVAAARSFETVWHERASTLQAGERKHAVRWWRDEHEVWRHVHDVALNRDSRARLALTRATHDPCLSYTVVPIEPIYAQYEEYTPAASQDEIESAAGEEIDQIHQCLLDLASMLSHRRDEASFRGFISGVAALDVFDAEPAVFTLAVRSRFCARQAALWHRLHEWLVLSDGSNGDLLRLSLERELRRAKRLWKTASVSLPLHRVLGELMATTQSRRRKTHRFDRRA